MIEKKPQGKKCPAIDGLIAEGQEIMKEYKGAPAVEHYEISRYGTLRGESITSSAAERLRWSSD